MVAVGLKRDIYVDLSMKNFLFSRICIDSLMMINQTLKKVVQVECVQKWFYLQWFHIDFNVDFVLINFKDVK